jgi:putative transposase
VSRPKRLAKFNYLGRARYFLTFCTHERQNVFRDGEVVERTLKQFRRTATIEKFAVLAYCFMPDHAHLLVEGTAAIQI